MKVGDLIECRSTSERGVIVSTRTSIGGEDAIIRVAYGVEWFTANLGKSSWITADTLQVIETND